MLSKIISIYGNQGSGKTVLTAQLALAIQQMTKKEVLIVGLDGTKPILPSLLPRDNVVDTGFSLGKILSDEILNLHTILKNVHMTKNDIALIGYNMNENYNTYAKPTQSRLDNFYLELSKVVDYCIIDCTADIVSDVASARAIATSDITIELLSAGVNGIVYDASQTPILLNQDYKFDKFLRYVSITDTFNHDIPAFENAVGKITGVIPYSEILNILFQQGESLRKPADKQYYNVVEQIAEIIMRE